MQSIAQAAIAAVPSVTPVDDTAKISAAEALQRKANRVRWLKLNFTVKAARLQTLKRQKYQHLQEEALLRARGLLHNWENNAVVLTEDLYRLAAGEREAEELMNYTPEALALRFSLRNDPHVLEAVRQLWQIEMPRDALGCIDQRGYASVFRRIAKCLDAKAFKKKQKVDKLLDEDWKRDSKGEPTMSFANFFDSIFELADLWCETIDADDYVVFLTRLRDRISQARRGKRTFKPLPKVLAFGADSDEEEEEEDEEDEDDEGDDEDEATKPSQPPQQPKLLITKAIKPATQQQQQPPQQRQAAANTLRKVSRVAISSSKVLQRKEPPPATTKAQSMNVTTLGPPHTLNEPTAVPTTPILTVPPTATPPAQDSISPLLHQQNSQHTMATGMPSRQRRASVVMTLQFLDDGFVRSITDNISSVPSSGTPPSSAGARAGTAAALPPSVVAAFAASARREQGMRPSLAAAANAALARNVDVPVQPVPAETPPSTAAPQPLIAQPSERKRVITVSTAKNAVLKSVVFATRRTVNPTPEERTAEGSTAEQDEQAIPAPQELPHDEKLRNQSEASPQSGGGPTKTRGHASATTTGGSLGNGVAIRIRTGSLFDLDEDQAGSHSDTLGRMATSTAKGARVGFGKAGAAATKRGRGGLAPLASHGQVGNSPAFTGMLQNQRNTLTAISHGPHGSAPTLNGTTSNGGIDFSDSVVMTNYVVERPGLAYGAQTLRAPNVLGGNAKKPPVGVPAMVPSTAGSSQSPGIQGTRALAKQSPILETDGPPPPSRELAINRPKMVVVANKPPPPQPATAPDPGHRYTGSNLRGTAHHADGHLAPAIGSTPLPPEGDPEHAIRIKAALDREHGHVRGKDALAHSPVLAHERHFDHTDDESASPHAAPVQLAERHGFVVETYPHSRAKPPHARQVQTSPLRVVPPQNLYMDPMATPWDTFDDEDDATGEAGSSASSARSLLQPENAMEALARLISKRTASHSAGSTREYRVGSAPSLASSVRRQSHTTKQDEPTTGREFDMAVDSAAASQVPRARMLTVASLGGNSVGNTHGKLSSKPLIRRTSGEEFGGDTDTLLGSASTPVLPITSQLELDYSQKSSQGSRRELTRTASDIDGSRSPLIKLPVRGHGHDMDAVNDLELRGEIAMDPSLSPPRSPVLTAPRTSPIKICTCSKRRDPASHEASDTHSWPPPVYRLDRASPSANDPHSGDDDERDPQSPEKCVECQRKRDAERSGDATIILNAKRELFLSPRSKEQDVLALASRATPSRSEMMRRRHRYTHGKPL